MNSTANPERRAYATRAAAAAYATAIYAGHRPARSADYANARAAYSAAHRAALAAFDARNDPAAPSDRSTDRAPA